MIPFDLKNKFYRSIFESNIMIFEVYGFGIEKIFIGDYLIKSDIKTKIIAAIDISEFIIKGNSGFKELYNWINIENPICLDINFENFSIIELKF